MASSILSNIPVVSDILGYSQADASKEAANLAAQGYQQGLATTQGMYNTSRSDLMNAGTTADKYLTSSQNAAVNALTSGYNAAVGNLSPYSALGQEGMNRYLALMQDPGSMEMTPYQKWVAEQGQKELQQSAAAKGMLGSGATLKALSDYNQNTARSAYNEELSRYAGLMDIGMGVDTNLANLATGQANSLAGVYGQTGAARANTALGAAQGTANAALNYGNTASQLLANQYGALAAGTMNAANSTAAGSSNALNLAALIYGMS